MMRSWADGYEEAMTLHGDDGLTILPGGTVRENFKDGSVVGDLSFQAPLNRRDLLPQMGSVHPYERYMWLQERAISYGVGYITMRGTYVGVNGFDDGDEIRSEKVHSLRIGTNEEPIETHLDFLTIAGKPSDPKNGAKFVHVGTGEVTADDDSGVFERFLPVVDGAKNLKAGLESYVAATNIVWRVSWTVSKKPALSLTGVGKVGTPEGPVPSVSSGWRWLYLGMDYDEKLVFPVTGKVEGVYSVSREWRLGRWDLEVYG